MSLSATTDCLGWGFDSGRGSRARRAEKARLSRLARRQARQELRVVVEGLLPRWEEETAAGLRKEVEIERRLRAAMGVYHSYIPID